MSDEMVLWSAYVFQQVAEIMPPITPVNLPLILVYDIAPFWREYVSAIISTKYGEIRKTLKCQSTILWTSNPVYQQKWNGPRQANLVLIAYASSEGSGEPAHPRSLTRTSAARSYKQWVKRNLQTESQIPGPSEWLGMRS